LLEGYYGVVQAHSIVMPLNVRLSPMGADQLFCVHSGARMLLFENDFAPLVEQLRPACREIHRFCNAQRKVPVADLTYEELLDKGHAERADIFSFDETAIASFFIPAVVQARPKASCSAIGRCISTRSPSRVYSGNRKPSWIFTPFRFSTRMAGAGRRPLQCWASSR